MKEDGRCCERSSNERIGLAGVRCDGARIQLGNVNKLKGLAKTAMLVVARTQV